MCFARNFTKMLLAVLKDKKGSHDDNEENLRFKQL